MFNKDNINLINDEYNTDNINIFSCQSIKNNHNDIIKTNIVKDSNNNNINNNNINDININRYLYGSHLNNINNSIVNNDNVNIIKIYENINKYIDFDSYKLSYKKIRIPLYNSL